MTLDLFEGQALDKPHLDAVVFGRIQEGLPMDTKKLLDEKQLAEHLGVAVKTVQCWRQRRKGPRWIKVVGAVRYRHADVDAWLEKGAVEPEEE